MNQLNIFKLSLKDYFTKQMLMLILYPLIGSVIILYMIFFYGADAGLDSLNTTQIHIQQHQTHIENGQIIQDSTSQTYTGNSILDFLLQFTATSWIAGFFVYSIGFFIVGYLSIFTSILIVGLLTPKILSIIHKKHYSSIKVEGYGTIQGGVWKLIKTFIVMMIMILFLFPFYLIPFINILLINIPFFYFFHKMLNYDVGSTIMSKEKYQQIYYFNKSEMRFKTLFLYIISLIPFVAFFISIFYIIYLGHTYFSKIEVLENN